MKEYLEKTLRQSMDIEECVSLYDKLPLLYSGRYTIFEVIMSGVNWIAMKPKKNIGLVELRKNRAMVEKVSGKNCALILENFNYYTKEKLIEEGIPFIIPEKQIYLPFVGILLADHDDRRLEPVHMISFLTQKVLLSCLYEKWENMTVTKVSEKMNVTKMSISRCFDEIEYLDIPVLGMRGKSRVINLACSVKEIWDAINPRLRDPVIARYELEEDIKLGTKAGISALCEYSLLSDNDYPTYAITKKDIKDLNLNTYRKVSGMEPIGCVVLKLGYFIDFNGNGVEDPLSTLLTLTDKETEDERVRLSINEMLKEYVW